MADNGLKTMDRWCSRDRTMAAETSLASNRGDKDNADGEGDAFSALA